MRGVAKPAADCVAAHLAQAAGLVCGVRQATSIRMRSRLPTTLDMTPKGEFVAPVPASTWPLRVGLGAALIAAVAGGLALAAVFLWVASVLVPIALVAGLIAYAAFRFQMWRVRSR